MSISEKKKKPADGLAFRTFAGIAILLAAFSIILGAIGYRVFSDAISEQYADGAFNTADSAYVLINPDRIDALADSGGETEEYKEVWLAIDSLCNSQGVTFIYIIQPDTTDYRHITFIVSTMNHSSDYDRYEFGYVRETTNDEYREKYRRLYEGKSNRELVVRDQGYIETDPHITAMIPIRDTNGDTKGILCVQRQMEKLVQVRHTYVRSLLLLLVVVMLIVLALQWMYLNNILIKPAQKVAEENKRINTELDLATKIQAAMLPSTFPAFPDDDRFSLYASMDPAREVGGDFYDFYKVDNDHLSLGIADVSGKGIPAALFMMATKIMIADMVRTEGSPAKVFEVVNKSICANNKEKMFLTEWLGILDLSTGKLICANAGHEYPMIKRTGEEYELLKDAHSFVIGGMAGAKYKEYALDLNEGDELFLYTDGVPEAVNTENEMFGTDRMLAVLNSIKEASPEEKIENMRKEAAAFAGSAERFDDMTMLCFRYLGSQGSRNEN